MSNSSDSDKSLKEFSRVNKHRRRIRRKFINKKGKFINIEMGYGSYVLGQKNKSLSTKKKKNS